MNTMEQIDSTIGIITWNSKELLKGCLNSIYGNHCHSSIEVVVVDNDSGDGTKEMLKQNYPQVTLVENSQNLGVAPARNQIIEKARGRYIIFLDVDTKLEPNAIDVLIKKMDENPDASIGGPKLIYGNGTLQLSCRPFPSPMNIFIEGTFLRDYFPNSRFVKKYTLEDWNHSDTREVDWMYGACLIVRRKSLEKIGFFDEHFFYLYEDIDFCFRAKKLGMKVIYFPQATVIHYLERERKSVFHRKIIIHIKSISRYLLKDYYGLIN